MAQDINLNSEAWRDLIFADKNKNYGAYQLRSGSNKRHLIAILISLFFVIAIISAQLLVSSLKAKMEENILTPVKEEVKITIYDEGKKEVKEKPALIVSPKEEKIIASIKVIPPKAVDKRLITEEAKIHTNDEIISTNKAIATADVDSNVKRSEGVTIDEARPQEEIVIKKDNNQILEFVEQKPDFPGGYNELMKYLGNNLRYPVPAIEQGVEGRVVIQFVVNKTGKISGVKIVQSLHPLCDKEAERLIKSMPDWIPGKQNGTPVNVYYTIPIRFKLQQQ